MLRQSILLLGLVSDRTTAAVVIDRYADLDRSLVGCRAEIAALFEELKSRPAALGIEVAVDNELGRLADEASHESASMYVRRNDELTRVRRLSDRSWGGKWAVVFENFDAIRSPAQ